MTRILAWLSPGRNGLHLYADCTHGAANPKAVEADPRAMQCATCVLRAIAMSSELTGRSHGTHAGYVSHRAKKQQACDRCLIAERHYQRQAKRRQRARAKEAA